MSLRRAFLSSARAVGAVERTVLAVLVAGMVGLSAAQVLMRNIWHAGWPWVEPLMGMALLCQKREDEAVPYYREAALLLQKMGDITANF